MSLAASVVSRTWATLSQALAEILRYRYALTGVRRQSQPHHLVDWAGTGDNSGWIGKGEIQALLLNRSTCRGASNTRAPKELDPEAGLS